MIKHSLEKIDKLIKERERPLPELMLKLYAFLLLSPKSWNKKVQSILLFNCMEMPSDCSENIWSMSLLNSLR